jgi:excisionase family DNA binding protein
VLGLPSGLPTCWRTSRNNRWTEHALARQQAESSNGTETSTGCVSQRGQSDLAIAFIEALDNDACTHLAERLRPYLRPVAPPPDEWLDSEAAAAYLSLPRSTLHKLTAERAIPFNQDGPGCKLYFKRSALDAWREC